MTYKALMGACFEANATYGPTRAFGLRGGINIPMEAAQTSAYHDHAPASRTVVTWPIQIHTTQIEGKLYVKPSNLHFKPQGQLIKNTKPQFAPKCTQPTRPGRGPTCEEARGADAPFGG